VGGGTQWGKHTVKNHRRTIRGNWTTGGEEKKNPLSKKPQDNRQRRGKKHRFGAEEWLKKRGRVGEMGVRPRKVTTWGVTGRKSYAVGLGNGISPENRVTCHRAQGITRENRKEREI